jgi:hypothetical protein
VKKPLTNNPYADEKGAPLKGKVKEFFAWAREQREKKLASMTEEERKLEIEAEERLNRRMNS